MTTEQELDNAAARVIENIMKAAMDYQNNPEKAREYIIRKAKALYDAGKGMGRQSVIDELFNGPIE